MGEWLRHNKSCTTCRAPTTENQLIKVRARNSSRSCAVIVFLGQVDLENDDPTEGVDPEEQESEDPLVAFYGSKPAALLRLIRGKLGGPALMGHPGWRKNNHSAVLPGSDSEARFVVFSQYHEALELMARTLTAEHIKVVFATGGLEAMSKFKVLFLIPTMF